MNVFQRIPVAAAFTRLPRTRQRCFELRQVLEDACWEASDRADDDRIELDVELDPALPDYVSGDGFGLHQLVNDAVAAAVRIAAVSTLLVRVDLLRSVSCERVELELSVSMDGTATLPGRIRFSMTVVASPAGLDHSIQLQGARARVLVVDPDRVAGRDTARVLFAMGHYAQVVDCEQTATRRIRKHVFDLVLVDENTPHVKRLVDSSGRLSERPAIIGMRSEARCLRLLPEVDGWLPKPMAPEILHPAIVSACGLKAALDTVYLPRAA
ncbi:MAG: hypothetical protein V3V08_03570 [Nannocystaceae bacterium]